MIKLSNMYIKNSFIILSVCLNLIAHSAFGAVAALDWAPLFSVDKDISGNRRVRILGPVFEHKNYSSSNSLFAVRPFYSQLTQMDTFCDRDVLWPLWIYRRTADDQWWWAVSIVTWRNWDITEDKGRYSLRVFPFYYQGRDKSGNDYAALFPFYGTIRDFLGRDRISFFLFPVYSTTKVNDVYTKTYFWPIFSKTQGDRVKRFRVFPFYGTAGRGNDFNKKFIMWPFFTSSRYGYEDSSGYGYILFPLVGHVDLTNQEQWLLIPPFFRISRSEQLNEIHCPWPFFQKSSGRTDKLYLWPFWGAKKKAGYRSGYVLWPLCTSVRRSMGDKQLRKFHIFPFVFGTSVNYSSDRNSQIVYEKLKLWPLFTYSAGSESASLKFPSLWPWHDFEVIARNYKPIWTLYSHSRHENLTEDEILWGLFRYRRDDGNSSELSLFPLFSVYRHSSEKSFSWSFLKGLIGYSREEQKKSIKIFYLFNLDFSR
jgi:hypothetical protein